MPLLPHPIAFLQNLSTPEICLFALVLLLFFGAKRLPGLFRSVGESVREFKSGRLEEADDVRAEDADIKCP